MNQSDGKFVVIIDDDASSVEVLGQFLTFLGIQYYAIFDSFDVLGSMEKIQDIDAIFLDLEFSRQNGYSVLKTIRRNMKWDRIPIVAYTSHTSQKYQAREAGFHSFLGKPLDSVACPTQLQKIINNQAVWD